MRPAIEAERADERRTLAARVASSTRRCTSLLRCARTCQKGKEKRKKNIVSFEHATLHLVAPLRPRRTKRETEKKRRAKEKQGSTKKKRKKEKKNVLSIHTHTYIHTRTHTHTRTYIHAHTLTHVHTRTHTYTYKHTFTYTYVRAHTHKQTHTDQVGLRGDAARQRITDKLFQN